MPMIEGMQAVSPFPLLGEPLSLDLVNTRVQQGGVQIDLLGEPADLQAWLGAQAGRVTWSDECTPDDVSAARALRAAVVELMNALETREVPDAAIATVNSVLHEYRGPELAWVGDGFEISTPQRSSQFAGVLHIIAADAVRLVAGPSGKLIRTCAHPQCLMRFVARNPRRQWCSTTGCGNRARVARSYTRRMQESA